MHLVSTQWTQNHQYCTPLHRSSIKISCSLCGQHVHLFVNKTLPTVLVILLNKFKNISCCKKVNKWLPSLKFLMFSTKISEEIFSFWNERKQKLMYSNIFTSVLSLLDHYHLKEHLVLYLILIDLVAQSLVQCYSRITDMRR